jgi:hypothetical protein
MQLAQCGLPPEGCEPADDDDADEDDDPDDRPALLPPEDAAPLQLLPLPPPEYRGAGGVTVLRAGGE